jgi:methylthioribose-1-phosphate isomerase
VTDSPPRTLPATLEWIGEVDGHLRLIDQTLLPTEYRHLDCHTVEDVWHAIKRLSVRGAPAIGIAAAYGVVIAMQSFRGESAAEYREALRRAADYLRTSRPTAVNLFWALERMTRAAEPALSKAPSAREITARLLHEARAIHEEDRQTCRAIGRFGAELLFGKETLTRPPAHSLTRPPGVLTHCNAGGLATADYGTALAVFFAAHEQGRQFRVYADETRPLLQGARLTAWELKQHGIPVTLLCDSMAGQVMKEGRVQAVLTGADRIAANGDTANKIGTYSVAQLARVHGIPFYVAAPTNTFDLSLEDGSQVPIEEREPSEVTHGFGRQTAPDGVDVYNPAFDVTPAELIAAIITEKGVIQPVNAETIRRVTG